MKDAKLKLVLLAVLAPIATWIVTQTVWYLRAVPVNSAWVSERMSDSITEDDDTDDFRAAVLYEVNVLRQKAGLPALRRLE